MTEFLQVWRIPQYGVMIIPQGTAIGNWYLIAKADGEGVLAETSEANNTLAKLIAIK